MGELSETTLQGIRHAADIIKGSHHAVVLTGAGISTPSGIPDFRSEDSGLWNRHTLRVASLTAFRYKPENDSTGCLWLRQFLRRNPIRRTPAWLVWKRRLIQMSLQNIDRLHQRAGSKNVLEVRYTGHFDLHCLFSPGRFRPYVQLTG
jgi:NAD-dependent deacetylase